MKTKLRVNKWTVALVAALFAGALSATEPPRANSETLGFSVERLAHIDEFYEDKVKRGEMAGIVTLVSRHGKIAHFSAVGYADTAKKEKLRTDAIFRLYSMTKPVGSTALMLLYEEGRFQLSDPLSKYIPEFANLRVLRTPDSPLNDTVPLERAPTVQDAFLHTVGFGFHGGKNNALLEQFWQLRLLSPDVSLGEFMRKLATVPLKHQPGTQFDYSVSPDIVARLVEVLSGAPFEQFLERRLLGPLGMKDTGYWVSAAQRPRLAAVHRLVDGKVVPLDDAHGYPDPTKLENRLAQREYLNEYDVEPRRKGGNSGLVSTAEDYWRFAQMMLNGGMFNGHRILSPSTIHYIARDHLVATPVLNDRGKPTGMGWGLGFAVVTDAAAAGTVIPDGSLHWAGAANTFFWIDPKNDIVVVAMTQSLDSKMDNWGTLRGQLGAMVYGALIE